MEYCSPYSKINSDNNISCYSKSILKKIAIQYNKYNKDKIIIPKNLDNDEQLKTVWDQILNKINKKYKYICKEEYCWKNLNFLNKKIKKKLIKNIRPEQPISWKKNNFEWLSTTDLNNALNPYKQLHQAYLYIGAIPLDYDYELIPGICISDELCKLNLKKLYFNKGIRYIGVVFNLDKHNQSGSHWVSFLANLNNGGIYYFDSIGIMPKNEVQKLMETIRIQGNNLIKDQLIDFSNISDEHKIEASYNFISNNKISVSKNINIQLDTPTIILNKPELIFHIIKISENPNNKKENILLLNKEIQNNQENNIILQKGFRKFYNNIRFQFKNSECGIYSIFFQTELLEGKKFVDFCTNVIDDNTINKLRQFYFSPTIKKKKKKKKIFNFLYNNNEN